MVAGTMLDHGKITAGQMGLLLVTLVVATSVLFVPAVTAEAAGKDGWIALLFPATIFGLLVAWVCISLGLRFPEESVILYSQNILGSVPGHLIGLGYIFLFMWISANVVYEFGAFMETAFMPETPLLVFNSVLVLLAGYAVKNGLEVMSRATQFVFPMLLATFLLLAAFSINDIQLTNFLPILEKGIKPVLKGSLLPSAWRGEIVLLLMLLPNLNRPAESMKAGIYAVIFLGIILTFDTVATVGVFGAELTGHLVFPFFSLSRYSRIAMVLERMEALTMIIWVTGVMLKVAIFYYGTVLALAQWLKLKDYKPLVVPVGIILINLSAILYSNSAELVAVTARTWHPFAFTFELLLPALLLAIAAVRKKGGNSR